MSVLGFLVFVIFAFDLLDMILVWFGGWLRECTWRCVHTSRGFISLRLVCLRADEGLQDNQQTHLRSLTAIVYL